MRSTVDSPIVHRVIERHAAACGDAVAVLDEARVVTFRELNYAANRVARLLMAAGFRRGHCALVNMSHGVDLTAVLLAVLKTGGCYAWSPSDTPRFAWMDGLPDSDGVTCCHEIDMHTLLQGETRPSPNLPVLVRSSDPACVILDSSTSSPVIVPHATLTGLRSPSVASRPWAGSDDAFELWLMLMAGEPVRIAQIRTEVAAA